MNHVDLPTVGAINGGHDLRLRAADVISQCQIYPAAERATRVRDFFIACANAADKTGGGSGSRVQVVTAT